MATEAEMAQRWSNAFLKQAASDRQAYEVVARASLPACHRLRYLQMWLEKLRKAHRLAGEDFTDGEPKVLRSHRVIAKMLPVLAREHWRQSQAGRFPQSLSRSMHAICIELDRLTPAVKDAERRADNCEYPWAAGVDDDGEPVVAVPCEQRFPVDSQLNSPAGVQLLKAASAWLEQQLRAGS